jgi:hypothetical protein
MSHCNTYKHPNKNNIIADYISPLEDTNLCMVSIPVPLEDIYNKIIVPRIDPLSATT